MTTIQAPNKPLAIIYPTLPSLTAVEEVVRIVGSLAL